GTERREACTRTPGAGLTCIRTRLPTMTTGVILVHGIRASRTMWRSQLAALEEAGVPALAPDLPGHGARADEEFTVEAALAAIEDAAESLGGEVVVVGLSLGGYF